MYYEKNFINAICEKERDGRWRNYIIGNSIMAVLCKLSFYS